MKKIIIFLTLLTFAISLYAKEPMVKFYMNDGSNKQYNISDIDTIGIIKSQNDCVMIVYYSKNQVSYYPTEVISKVQFGNDNSNNKTFTVYVNGYPKSFLLSSIDSISYIIDIYQPITIGSQVWMLKNLNVSKLRDGSDIPEAKDSATWLSAIYGAWCYYDNNESNGAIYGKLYNWYAVFDPRQLAPAGWHIPTNIEWDTLMTYLGGEYLAGGKCKENGLAHWANPNTDGTNECGYTALPGGYRYDDCSFGYIKKNGYWWSATKYDAKRAWAWYLLNYSAEFMSENFTKEYGFSVRCIKDK